MATTMYSTELTPDSTTIISIKDTTIRLTFTTTLVSPDRTTIILNWLSGHTIQFPILDKFHQISVTSDNL